MKPGQHPQESLDGKDASLSSPEERTSPSTQGQTTNIQQVIGPKELRRWGETIRQRRRDLDLTLKQLAEITGISFGYLAKLERGDADAMNPTRQVIDALRSAINIPPPGGEQLSRTVLASWVSDESAAQGVNRITLPQHEIVNQKEEQAPGVERWQLLEALLLICGRLNAAQIAAGLGCGLFEVEEAAQTLQEHLSGQGVVLQEMHGEYQLASHAGLAQALRAALVNIGLAPRRQTQLTQAQREVLALIIMHQPITRSAIERYRGVDSGSPLHTLVEAELVAVLPKTTPQGAHQYISTLHVLEEFGYSTLEALHQAIRQGLPTTLKTPKTFSEGDPPFQHAEEHVL
jgi:chromosome segregation and condensation protein ScpB/DNA-binding transcriptional regulator YiaG